MGGLPEIWKRYEKCLKVFAFEPDERESAKLKEKLNYTLLHYALAEKIGKMTFNIAHDPGKSSVFEPNLDFLSQFPCSVEYTPVRKLVFARQKVQTLDSLKQKGLLPEVDFIKVDTQGAELSILKGGARRILHAVLGIQVEVEFHPLYKAQPLFRDVDEFLTRHNFELIDLKRYYWKRTAGLDTGGKGQLVFADALYFKRSRALQEILTGMEKVKAHNKFLKAIALCLIYNMSDFAHELVAMGLRSRLITQSDVERLNVSAPVRGMTRERSLKGLHTVTVGLSYLQRFLLRFNFPRWAQSDRELGNSIDA